MESAQAPQDLPEHATLSYHGTGRVSLTVPLAGEAGGDLATSVPPAGEPHEIRVAAPESGYRLLRRVATGGMGEVWEAVQVSLGRVVAIKAVRPDRLRDGGVDAGQVAEEFRREAVFAARLEHPNILPVHDLGRDPKGAPILAMKFVQGTPWDRALAQDLQRISPAELLARHLPILIAVSQAVAFAHSRGIVHRDLKPAQVMLGEFGEVLLIDWGLAMFVGGEQQLEDARQLGLPMLEGRATASNPSGTPALMAPEQTIASAAGIGTWTDIYLLGGTLYFILTGTYPHEDESVHRAFMRAHEGVVQPPSERAPNREIPPDLEELCLHALRREPADRPATAQEFIAALQAHLSGESKRRESRALAERARGVLSAGNADYASFNQAGALIEQAAGMWIANPELAPLRREVFSAHARLALRNGDLVLARLQAERLEEAGTREGLLADVARAEQLAAERARTRRLAITASILLLALTIIGGAFFTRKLAASRDAEAAQRALAEEQRDLAKDARAKSDELARFVLRDMTNRLASLDRLDLLDPAMERAFGYYRSLPLDRLPAADRISAADGLISVMDAARRRGNSSLQRSAADQLEDILSTLPPSDAQSPEWTSRTIRLQQERSLLHRRLGDIDAAITASQEAVRLLERAIAAEPQSLRLRGELGETLGGLAQALGEGRNIEGSLAVVERAISLQEEVVRGDGGTTTSLARLAIALRNRTELLGRMNRREAGEASLTRLREVVSEIAAKFPGEADAATNAAMASQAAAEWYSLNGRTDDAIAECRRAIAILRTAIAANPAQPSLPSSLIGALSSLATQLQRVGDRNAALEAFKEALSIASALRERDPRNNIWARQRLAVLNNTIVLLGSMNRHAEAEPLSDEQTRLAEEIYRATPEIADAARGYVVAHQRRAGVLMALGRMADALPVAQRGVELADSIAAAFPGDERMQQDTVVARTWLAGALYNLDQRTAAVDALKGASARAHAFAEANPLRRDAWENLGSILSTTGTYQNELGMTVETIESQRQSAQAYRRLLELDPARSSAAVLLAGSLQRLADMCFNAGRLDDGLAAGREAVALTGRILAHEPANARLLNARANAALMLARVLAEDAQESESVALISIASECATENERLLDPRDAISIRESHLLHDRLAQLRLLVGEASAAEEAMRRIQASRIAAGGSTFNDRLLLAQLDDHLARALIELGRSTEAVAHCTSATRQLEVLRAEDPERGTLLTAELAVAIATRALAHDAAGNFAAAIADASASEDLWRQLIESDRANARLRESLARVKRTRGESLLAGGNAAEAVTDLAESAAILADGIHGASPSRQNAFVAANAILARALAATGDIPGAQARLRDAALLRSPNGDSQAARAYRDRIYWLAEGDVRAAAGDTEGARQAWLELLSAYEPRATRQFPPRARAPEGIALYRLGREEEARAIRDAVAALDAKGSEILRVVK